MPRHAEKMVLMSDGIFFDVGPRNTLVRIAVLHEKQRKKVGHK